MNASLLGRIYVVGRKAGFRSRVSLVWYHSCNRRRTRWFWKGATRGSDRRTGSACVRVRDRAEAAGSMPRRGTAKPTEGIVGGKGRLGDMQSATGGLLGAGTAGASVVAAVVSHHVSQHAASSGACSAGSCSRVTLPARIGASGAFLRARVPATHATARAAARSRLMTPAPTGMGHQRRATSARR